MTTLAKQWSASRYRKFRPGGEDSHAGQLDDGGMGNVRPRSLTEVKLRVDLRTPRAYRGALLGQHDAGCTMFSTVRLMQDSGALCDRERPLSSWS